MSVIDLLSQLGRMAAAVPMAVAAEVLAPAEAEGTPGWQELRNRTRAFERFWEAPPLAASGFPPGEGRPPEKPRDVAKRLARRLAEADAGGEPGTAWNALWLREGLGLRWVDAVWDGRGTRGAPEPEEAAAGEAAWRTGWRLPLHTGAGLCLAIRTLAPLVWEGRDAPVVEPVERFAALCREVSREGCELAAFEALGLIGWVLYPGRVGAIDGVLRSWKAERGAAWRESFWHGVGRGLYFTPVGSLPWQRPAAWRLRTARAEAPDAAARRNAICGLGWALALVNFLQPELVAEALPAVETSPEDEAAFVEGIARATVVWVDGLAPQAEVEGSDRLEAFLEGRGGGASDGRSGTSTMDGGERAGAEERWRRRVAPECRRALDAWLSGGRLPERFGELFRLAPERETTEP